MAWLVSASRPYAQPHLAQEEMYLVENWKPRRSYIGEPTLNDTRKNTRREWPPTLSAFLGWKKGAPSSFKEFRAIEQIGILDTGGNRRHHK